MDRINIHNYEEYFIDYFDGNLNNHQIADLMLFLAQNPSLDKEFNQYKNITIDFDKNIHFPNKKGLLKQENTITGNSLDDKVIAYLEDDLSANDKKNFNNELKKDNNLKSLLNQYKNTFLTPDKNIKFENKNTLKKQLYSTKNQKVIQVYSYAASIVILILFSALFYYYPLNKEKQNNIVVKYAENKKTHQDKNIENVTIIKKETPSIVAPIEKPKVSKVKTITPQKAKLIDKEDINIANTEIIKPKTDNDNFMAFVNNLNSNISEYLSEEQTEDINNQELTVPKQNKQKLQENKSNFWDMLGAGISKLTGNKIKRVKKGNKSMLVINSKKFKLVKPIK